MDTKVKIHPDLPNHAVIAEGRYQDSLDGVYLNVPIEIFESHEILVIDDINWNADLDLLAAKRVNKHKPYEDEELPQRYKKSEAPREVKAELAKLEAQIGEIFLSLYGSFENAQKAFSWRPLITGPEPIHFDGYEKPNTTTICSFVNFDKTPRSWRVSYTLPGLIEAYPKLVKELWQQAIDTRSNFNVILRHRTQHGEAPFDVFHEIEFPQGALWICNPKTVSHGIHFGRGACLYALHVEGLNPELLQENIIKEAFRAGAL